MKNILPNDIIKEWELGSLPEERQKEVVERIGKIIYQALLVRSLDILSEKEQDEMDVLLNKDATTPEDILSFLQKKIPSFEKLVLQERDSLKNDLLVQV